MATSTGLSQSGFTRPSEPQVAHDKSVIAAPSGLPDKSKPDALDQILEPGRTGVFDPTATFKAKTYSKPEDADKTAGMPNTAEFHSSAMDVDSGPSDTTGTNHQTPEVADEDENMEPTKEELAEREAMLRAGAENAVKQANEPNRMPLAVAVEIDKAAELFRAAFSKGQTQEIMKEFHERNQTIRGINKALGNTYKINGEVCYDRHMMSEGIFAHIAQLREELATLLQLKGKGKAGSNDPDWTAHNKQVVQIALAARKPLTEMSLSWRSITPDDIWAIVQESFSQALPLMDKDIQRVAFALLHLEWQKPTHSQEVACTQSLVPMRNFFEMMDLGDTTEAMGHVKELKEVNEEIVKVNKQCNTTRESEDHTLPIEFFTQVVADYSKIAAEQQTDFLNTARGLLAALLETLGYDALASDLPKESAPNTLDESALNEVKSVANQRLLEWRGIEYSEKVRSLMSERPATASGADQPISRDAHGPTAPGGQPEQVTDGIFVDQAEPDRVTVANSDAQPSTRCGSGPGLKARGVRGPIVEDRTTMYGQVVGSRGLARGASRHILNVGTKLTPVYKCFPGATFGRGTGAEWVKQYPLPQARDVRDRKASEVSGISGIAIVETESKGRNHPITYFPVSWKGEKKIEWLTRSELLSVCGKRYVTEAFDKLYEEWRILQQFLEEMKQKGLHPDTEEPLTDADIADMPWLGPVSQGRKNTNSNKSIPKADPNDNSTAHIKLGTGRFGAPRI